MSPVCFGIDLNATTPDEVIVLAGPAQRVHHQPVSTSWEALRALLETVFEKVGPQRECVVILEATGMAWFPVAAFFAQHEIPVFRVTGQRSSDLRQFLEKHAKTDPIDAQTLALMYYLIPEHLDRLELQSPAAHALKRWLQRREDYLERHDAELNRLQALVRWALPGLAGQTARLTQPTLRPILKKAVNFAWMRTMGEQRFTQWARRRTSHLTPQDCARIYQAAMEARQLYGAAEAAQVYAPDELEAELADYLQELAHLEERLKDIEATIRALNRVVLPDKPLTSLRGTAELTEAVIKAFLGDGSRFPNRRCAEAYVSYIPKTDQSGERDRKGTRMRKDGPAVLKKFLFNAVETARQWDPQIAEKYYREMVEKGHPHTKAICNCVNAYVGRILRVLRTGAPYQLRDCQDHPITPGEARQIVEQHYRVPETVRDRWRSRAA